MTKKKQYRTNLPSARPPAPRGAPDMESVGAPPAVPLQASEPRLEQVNEMIRQLVSDLDEELDKEPAPQQTTQPNPRPTPQPSVDESDDPSEEMSDEPEGDRDPEPEALSPEAEPLTPEPQPEPEPQARTRSTPVVVGAVRMPQQPPARRRPQLALLRIVAVGVLVAFGGGYLLTRLVGDPGAVLTRGATAPSSVLGAPTALLPGETYVASEVQPGGEITVDQWIRSTNPIDQVWLTLPDTGARDALSADDIEVLVDGGPVAGPADLTDGQAIFTFDQTTAVRISYVLSGAVQTSGTVAGRALALATSIDVKVAAGTARETRVVRAPRVLSLGCAVVAEDVAPCGNAVSKRAWRVELDGDQLTDRVVAQVELSR